MLDTMGVLVELSTDSYNNYAGFRMWFQSSGGTQPTTTTTTETHTTGQLIVLLHTYTKLYFERYFERVKHQVPTLPPRL